MVLRNHGFELKVDYPFFLFSLVLVSLLKVENSVTLETGGVQIHLMCEGKVEAN